MVWEQFLQYNIHLLIRFTFGKKMVGFVDGEFVVVFHPSQTRHKIQMSQTIFTVTAIDIRARGFDRCRCFGFFFTLEKAREAVRNNSGGMHECKYTHLVIEEQGENIHAHAEAIDWYKWTIDTEIYEGFWNPHKRPVGEDNDIAFITNFNGIG